MKYIRKKKLNEGYFKNVSTTDKKKSKEEVLSNIAATAKNIDIQNHVKQLFKIIDSREFLYWNDFEVAINNMLTRVRHYKNYKMIAGGDPNFLLGDTPTSFFENNIPYFEDEVENTKKYFDAARKLAETKFTILGEAKMSSTMYPLPEVICDRYLDNESDYAKVLKDQIISTNIQIEISPEFWETPTAEEFTKVDNAGLHLYFTGQISNSKFETIFKNTVSVLKLFIEQLKKCYLFTKSKNPEDVFNPDPEFEDINKGKIVRLIRSSGFRQFDLRSCAFFELIAYMSVQNFMNLLQDYSKSLDNEKKFQEFIDTFVYPENLLEELKNDFKAVQEFLEVVFKIPVEITFQGFWTSTEKNENKIRTSFIIR